jgi:hypothetical protein
MEELQNYWEEYNFNRFNPVNLETFEVLVLMFPILAVVAADNDIDGAERNFYLEQIEKKAENSHHLKIRELKDEVNYITQNIQELYPLMLSSLKILVEKNGLANYLMDMMLMAAKVSYEPWQTKTLYGETESRLKFPKKIIDLMVEDSSSQKERVSEDELRTIKYILEKTNALNERNQLILEAI